MLQEKKRREKIVFAHLEKNPLIQIEWAVAVSKNDSTIWLQTGEGEKGEPFQAAAIPAAAVVTAAL